MPWWNMLVGIWIFMAPGLVGERVLPPLQGVQVREWTYTSDGLKVKGLLFVPPGAKRLPLVVFSHDGISGISKYHRMSSARLAKAGPYVVFAPSYRGEDGSEGTIEVAKGEVRDVLNALPLLSALPEVDPQRIALAGASHGALISLLAAAQNPEIKAVVTAYGVTDIYRWWDYLKKANKVGNDEVTRRTYGGGPQDRPQSFAIRHALAVADKIQCPVLILQGEKDDIVPPEQGRFLKDALGSRAQLELYPDALHGFLVYAPYLSDVDPRERRQTEQAWKVMLSFLDRQLKAAPPPEEEPLGTPAATPAPSP